MTPSAAPPATSRRLPRLSPHDPQQLFEAGLITPEEFSFVEREVKRGASAISALSLGTADKGVWEEIAQSWNVRSYRTHSELKVMATDLITYSMVLETGIIPHRTRGLIIQGVTYDPQIITRQHPRFPGTMLDIALVAPSTWRHLYDLAYPTALTGDLAEEQAVALISFSPTGTSVSITPEQKAELNAIQTGVRYIDIRRDPVDDDVREMFSPTLKTIYQAYPHHLEGEALVVVMLNPTDQRGIHAIEGVTQRTVIPAVTTAETIAQLIAEDDLRNDASSIDEGLDRLTRLDDFSGG